MSIDIERLQHASMQVSDIVADPSRWTELLAEVAVATGAMGAALIPQTGSEGRSRPRTSRNAWKPMSARAGPSRTQTVTGAPGS